MTPDPRWSDLRTRLWSAAVLVAIGVAAVWIGGPVFVAVVCVSCGIMIWEAAQLHDVRYPVALAGLATGVLAGSTVVPPAYAGAAVVALGLVAAGQARRDPVLCFMIVCWIAIGAFSMLVMRTGVGMLWILWLICVVIASDVAGYFAGRRMGGPKFWPAVSPKKTWSGTIAGWLAAALVGALFVAPLSWNWTLVPVSVVVGFAGQMGDIAQSALKRRMGVKDSSSLIPGHGGVFDRFDAMLGASAAALVFKIAGLLPGLSG
ncbi:MAG: phosphatidate cytidylyltransferase [Pseudomonadota bacterium]